MSIVLWLLGALGLGGAGIGVAALLGGGPAMLLFGGKALAFAKGLSPKAWLYIAIAAAVVGGGIWHQHAAHRALKMADAAGYARAMNDVAERQKKIDAAALKLKQKVDAITTKISQEEYQRYEESAHHSGAVADELRHRPPPRLEGGSGQAQPGPATAAGAQGGSHPADAGLAQIPWLPLIDRAEQCDVDHAARVAWDRWYERVKEAWPK